MPRVEKELNERVDADILTTLSMNGRATLDFIGKHAGGLSKHPAYRRVKSLEQKYGIKYVAELDVSAFGYLSYMAYIKFRGKVPNLQELKEALEKNPHIQLVVLTNGLYDMIIYFLSDSARNAAYLIFQLKTTTIIKSYPSNWYVTSYDFKDFIPIRDEFFELLRSKVWQRTRAKKKPGSSDLIEREFLVLRELNRNGAVSFTDLDTKLNLGKGASRYTYYKLKEKGILKRISITLTNLPIKYNAILMTNSYHGEEFARTRPNLLIEIIKEGKIIDKYVHATNIGVPSGSMLVMPVFEYGELKDTEDEISSKVKGIEVTTLVVTGTVLGNYIYRRYDKSYTDQYDILANEYKVLKPRERINYDETSGTRRSGKNEEIDLGRLDANEA